MVVPLAGRDSMRHQRSIYGGNSSAGVQGGISPGRRSDSVPLRLRLNASLLACAGQFTSDPELVSHLYEFSRSASASIECLKTGVHRELPGRRVCEWIENYGEQISRRMAMSAIARIPVRVARWGGLVRKSDAAFQRSFAASAPTRGTLKVLVTVLAAAAQTSAATLRVPADYPTLCEAIPIAEFGDTVLVAPGSHDYMPGMCGYPQIPDGVVLTSESGPESTILLVSIWGPCGCFPFYFADDAGLSTEVSGFTIVYSDVGGASSLPAIFVCLRSSPRIVGNLIRPHPDWPFSSLDTIVIACSGGSEAIIQNNTIIGGFVGLGIFQSPAVTVQNNILASMYNGISCGGVAPAVSCNLLWGIKLPYYLCSGGHGDILEDPMFCDAESFDFSLRSDSPAARGYGCGLLGAIPVGCGATAASGTSWGTLKIRFR